MGRSLARQTQRRTWGCGPLQDPGIREWIVRQIKESFPRLHLHGSSQECQFNSRFAIDILRVMISSVDTCTTQYCCFNFLVYSHIEPCTIVICLPGPFTAMYVAMDCQPPPQAKLRSIVSEVLSNAVPILIVTFCSTFYSCTHCRSTAGLMRRTRARWWWGVKLWSWSGWTRLLGNKGDHKQFALYYVTAWGYREIV